MATVPFVMVVAVVLALGMVGLLVLTTALQEQAFGVQRTQREANTLAIRLSALQDQIATARSIQNLSVAAQHLGMRPNPYGAQIRITDGVVIGDPKVVLGGEVPTVRYLTPEQAQAQVRALDRAEAERKAKAKAARAEAKARAKAKAEAKAKAKAEAQFKADAEAAAKAKKGGRP
jgi:sRNA-binding protein